VLRINLISSKKNWKILCSNIFIHTAKLQNCISWCRSTIYLFSWRTSNFDKGKIYLRKCRKETTSKPSKASLTFWVAKFFKHQRSKVSIAESEINWTLGAFASRQ